MKAWWIVALVLGTAGGLAAQDRSSAPVTLVNALADRPLFTYTVQGVVQTRALAPGNRLVLPAGLFSGLGEKKLSLEPGETYYLARLGALPRVYRLPADQVLILNQSGTAVPVTLGEPNPLSANLAAGTLALGSAAGNQGLEVSWTDPSGIRKSTSLAGGRVYRLVLDSPEGTGVTVSLVPWD